MYEGLPDAQKDCAKKLATTVHFDPMKMLTALSLMKVVMGGASRKTVKELLTTTTLRTLC